MWTQRRNSWICCPGKATQSRSIGCASRSASSRTTMMPPARRCKTLSAITRTSGGTGRNAPRDQVFDVLIDAVGGHAGKIEHMPDATPIRVALLAAAKLPLPADALQSADPAVLRAWATNANVPAERRLAAAERAAALGAL